MELEIQPLEGGIYLTRIVTGSMDADTSTIAYLDESDIVNICKIHDIDYVPQRKFYSLSQVKDYYAALHPAKVWLCYQTPCDEMIGLEPSECKSHNNHESHFRQPLHWFEQTH